MTPRAASLPVRACRPVPAAPSIHQGASVGLLHTHAKGVRHHIRCLASAPACTHHQAPPRRQQSPAHALAADVTAKGGATKLMTLKTVSDIEALKPGDIVVMACAKCDTITETRVEHPSKGAAGAVETKVAAHTCPGCGAKWEVDGHGKAKTEKLVHVCSHCGAKGAVCAVRKAKE